MTSIFEPMKTRAITREDVFPAAPEALFRLLHTPSEIRRWWGAARAIVIATQGGLWVAAWGTAEDAPDYIAAATISEFRPPQRLVLSDYRYYARAEPLPFEADFVTEFEVMAHPDGSVLRVAQRGFPGVSEADAFYAACEQGWRDTFAGIRRYLAEKQ